MSTADLRTHVMLPRRGTKPTKMVVLLHGYGADGRDLLGLATHWEKTLPDCVFIAPDAPFACEMSPMGFQWFSLADWSPDSLKRGAADALPRLIAFLEEQKTAYGLQGKDIVLGGFSQGAMMTLRAGAHLADQPAGLMSFSGAVVDPQSLASPQTHRPPVLLVHGHLDTVVPFSAWTDARTHLESAGYPLTPYAVPDMGHEITPAVLREAGAFLSHVFQ